MPKPLPNPEMLRKLLRYEPDTGKLFWRARTPDLFKVGRRSKEWNCSRWNALFSGRPAFTSDNGTGYKRGSIFDSDYLAHRIIWAMVHGAPPEATIDHINGDQSDNRIENLRDVPQWENNRIKRIRSDNTSGATGVWWNKTEKKWHSVLELHGEDLYKGKFVSKSDAIAARKAAESAHGINLGERK